MQDPLAYVSDGDAQRVQEILVKLDEIRQSSGATSTDHAYWQGYLTCYCEQNAVSDEALSLLAKKA